MYKLQALLALYAATVAQARPSSYAVWGADSAIARSQGTGIGPSGTPLVSYDDGTFQWGLRLLYEQTGNQTYYDWILKGANTIVASNGTIDSTYKLSDYSLDPVRTGPTFLYLYEKTKAAKWKTAADTYVKQLNGHPRTGQGQFWHKLRYPNQGWLDGLYMADVFYAQYTKRFDPNNQTAWNDIALQFTLQYQNTLQNTGSTNYTGLLYHGYDYSHTASWASSDRGHSIEQWDRAIGWYMMALVDTLESFPTSHAGYQSLLTILQTLAPRIIKAADPTSGVWWLVLTQPGRSGNYFESSGTAMFIYSILRGIRLGYIKDTDGSLVKGVRKAYAYTVANWVKETSSGTMNWENTVEVGSLSGNGTFEYYISVAKRQNDLKGLAAFILASTEYDKLA